MIYTKIYNEPEFNLREVLRYAGADAASEEMARECIEEVRRELTYRVCYGKFPVEIHENKVVTPVFSAESEKLKKNLDGCDSVIIFGSTVGIGIDRLIARYGSISPVKALFFQGIGAERIEALCDTFCEDMRREYGDLRPRFSPGYGDFGIEHQKNIFASLELSKKIGLSLNASLLMSPTKSVTAICGIGPCSGQVKSNCAICTKFDCEFRKKEI